MVVKPRHNSTALMVTWIVLSTTGMLLAPTGVVHAQTAENAEATFARLRSFVRKAMLETAVPGVAIGVLSGDDMHTAGLGVTNVDHPLEVTDETLFQVGSISKTFAGTAMMRLVDDSRIDLDAPIRTYLPEFDLQSEETAATATVRHLLTHMGGWVGDYFNFDTPSQRTDALETMIGRMAELGQLAPIGSVWSYSNSGFYVAGRVIEVVTGQLYEDAIRELVFEPVGLHHSYFRPEDVMTHRFAVGHNVAPDGIRVAQPWALFRAAYPAGGVATSIMQLLTYASFHMGNGTNHRGERVLTRASLAEMQGEQADIVGTDDGMGLTWFLRDIDGIRTVDHSGATVGQMATLVLVPERDFALAVLTNANRGQVILEQARRWALKEYLGLTVADPEPEGNGDFDLSEYVGLYSRPMADLHVTSEGGQLMIQVTRKLGFPTHDSPVPPPGPPAPFGFSAPDRLVGYEQPATAEVIRRSDGSIGWLRFGGRIHAKQ